MVKYFCDGCNREFDRVATIAEAPRHMLAEAVAFSKKHNRPELFCPEQCQKWAEDYWQAVIEVERKAQDMYDGTCRNFRNHFFSGKTFRKVG